MVVGPDDHFVAGLEVETARHGVIAFGRVARDDDFLRRHTKRRRQEPPCFLAPLRQPRARCRGRIGLVFPRVSFECLDDGQRGGTQVGGIEKGEILRDQKTGANLSPELLVGLCGRARKWREREPLLLVRLAHLCEGAVRDDRGGPGEREEPGEVPAGERGHGASLKVLQRIDSVKESRPRLPA